MIKISLYIFFLAITLSINAQNRMFDEQLDSIQKLRLLSNNENLDLEKRIAYAKQASDLSYKTDVDSTIMISDKNKLDFVYNIKDFNLLKNISYKKLKLARSFKDSTNIAFFSSLLGSFYLSSVENIRTDSAFYYYNVSQEVYKGLKDNFNRALILHKIAIIQKNKKNHIGSEISSIKSLSLFKTLKDSDILSKNIAYEYNNLGIVYKELKFYDKSKEYLAKGLKIKKEIKDDLTSIYITYNNLGTTYEFAGEYDLAIKNYLEILKDKNFINESPSLYALVLDNYAYALYLSKKHKKLPKLYLRALKICDNIGDSYKSIIIHQHLAEYYHGKNKKDSALYYAYKAKELSEHYYNDDLLKSLLILSKIETDSIAVKHYKAYINLNDSIQHQERLSRNKFARIQFETDEYIDEAKRLNTQNILIITIAGILIITLCLFYFIKQQQDKNKTLLFEKEQQETNQEIYSLMLKQQTKLERAKMQERYRIGDGLHDRILNHLFGTRMSMGFLELKGDEKTLKDYNLYLNKIQNIEKEVRDVSHQLKSNAVLPKTNFESLINHYINEQSLIGCFSYDITNKAIQFDTLDDGIKVNLYRIIQESIQNIIKHAKAKHVTIQFYDETHRLNLVIEDDGIGFDVKANKKGIGLKNISSRVLNLNGIFKIDSISNKKTLIHIIIPI